MYLPKSAIDGGRKLPILVYFHGGGFCYESAFSLVETKLMNSLASEAELIAVSIEYRLAPENPMRVVYDDCWAGLQWVASHSGDGGKDPWIKNYGDFDRVFIGGDSAGGNIVHNIAMRAGHEDLPGRVILAGALLTHPYFWGSKPIGSEKIEGHEECVASRAWNFVSPGGLDDPMINPLVPEALSLAGLGCRRLFISVAGLDFLKDRGIMYYNAVKQSGFEGEVEFAQIEGEDHAFHILKYGSESSRNFIKRLALFISN
jgi:acetyl esterase/lipase